MTTARTVIETLRRSGDLWETGEGLVGLRGAPGELHRQLSEALRGLCLQQTDDEWRTPPVLAFGTLERADYFASFPQWLTATAHLDGATETLARVAGSDRPADEAVAAMRPAKWALQPAVCYHVYQAHAGRVLNAAQTCTLEGTCWRHETRFAPLERGWPFTMREAVCVGEAADVRAFRETGRANTVDFARRLGLDARVEPATDPFFAASARGRELLQRLCGLKDELLLPIGGGQHTAAASFNDHAGFFGEAFDIRAGDGIPAISGCVAFGVERWLLALLVAHGTDPRAWPIAELEATRRETTCAP